MTNLGLANFTTGSTASNDMFGDTGQIYNGPTQSLNQLTLGNDTHINHLSYFPGGSWKNQNSNSVLSNNQLNDGNSHPGTWTQIR